MLYIFDEIEMLSDDFPESKMSLLSVERREKVQRLRSQSGKKESVAAYLLLRIALAEIYGIYKIVEFAYLYMGKPILRDFPQIHFSLSHTKGVAACAVSDFEVGVDVQVIRPVTDKVAKRVLSDAEYAEFKIAQNPDEFFCEIWAIKESCMKKSGQGMAAAFKKLPVNDIADIKVFREKDYFCSVCGSITQNMQIKHIRREDFEKLHN